MLRLSKNSGLHPTCLSIQNAKKIGEYPIAAGGFGDVWKGTIGDSSELVCLKVVKVYLKSDLVKLTSEYLREAILWRQLKHPNVLPFFGIYRLEHTQQLCLISPWMEKGNLVGFLKATKREDVDHYTLVYDVTSGLAYLHSRKIVHGDLKGLNILITCSFRACIADFGLSRITDTNGLRITTSTTRPVGTARWLAPELLIGSGGPSKESDVYSYACVCYEIFTGLQPFPELANEMTVAFNVAQGKRPSRPEGAPELSDAMWALMNVCWDANPSSRPSASHVLEKVEQIAVRVLPASDWSESLFTQVWENVEYRSLSPGSRNGSQIGDSRIFSNLLEATPSPGTQQRTTSDPVPDSLPFSSVDAPATFSEVENRLDDDSGPSSSGVKGVSSHPDHLKTIHEAQSQIQFNGSLLTPLETDVEPPEVLSSFTRQGSNSCAKARVSSPEDLNISMKDELHSAVGTIEIALPQSLQVVIKDFWDGNLKRGRAQEHQDQNPAQDQAHQQKNPNLTHHHNNMSNDSISMPPPMGILRALYPPHAHQHLPGTGHPHQTYHHHQHTGSTDPTATMEMIVPSRPSSGTERYPSMNSLAPSTMVTGYVRKGIREKQKDRKEGGWLSRRTSGSHDKDKDKDYGQRERSQSWQLVHPEEQGGQLTRLIGFLTATSSENWALVLDVCARASASDSNAKEVIRALCREFKYGAPQAQLSAARLWAIILRNSTDTFIGQSTSRKFLETLEELLVSSTTNAVVKERVLDVLAAATYASGSNKDTEFRGLWKKVKPHDKPDEVCGVYPFPKALLNANDGLQKGMPLDIDNAVFNTPAPVGL
ncbi:hypothetical protein PM082_009119 [Marasmius tenuissimus]|nr:hypothetical protein PM082_009119 [Marasmius tenuissimus]